MIYCDIIFEGQIDMIPKIIHYVWVGDKEKSEQALKCIESWKKFCPDYEIIEWNNEKFEKIKNLYSKQAYENKKWAFVSDYIRLYALYNYGGVYLDADLEITQNIDKFLENDFFIGFEEYENQYNIMSALIGAVPHCKIIKDLLLYYQTSPFETTKNGYDTTANTKRITKYLEKNFNMKPPYSTDKPIILKDKHTVYPYFYFCKKEDNKENYAIHHYNVSWFDRYRRRDICSIGGYTVSIFKEINKKSQTMPVCTSETVLKKYKLNSKKSLVIVKKMLNKKENSTPPEPLITIIIPVYNVEKYLKDCLDSVINQTYKNFEVICVNDGSTDNCPEILKRYQEKDSRFNVITQTNKGLAAARNAALEYINGEYFYYLDSDDYIHPQTLELLYNAIKDGDFDLASCGFGKTTKMYKDNNFVNVDSRVEFEIIQNPLERFTRLKSGISPSVWTNLYKTEKFKDIRFAEGYEWEDVFYTVQCFHRISQLKYLDLKLYQYRKNPDSISLTKFSKLKIDSHINNIKLINDYFKNGDKKAQRIKEKLTAKYLRRVMNDVDAGKDCELKRYLKQELKKLYEDKLISFKYLKLSKWPALWGYLK